jgi:hypothetical protein
MEPNKDETLAEALFEGIGEELANHEILLGIFADVERAILALPEDKQREYLAGHQYEGDRNDSAV